MAIEGGEVTIQSGDNNQAADAAEAAKVEAAQAELAAEEQAGEPDKILGRFESVDDLASAYQELQRAYSKGKAEDEPEAEADDEPEEEAPEASDDADDADDDDDDQPLSKEEVDQMRTALHDAVGGADKYQAMTQWASANMKASTKEAWNDAIEDGDIEVLEQMAKGFMWDMQQSRGYEPKLGGGRAPTNDAKAFKSEAEVVELMNDPRYRDPGKRDPAFVKEVERRIAMSDVFNSSAS